MKVDFGVIDHVDRQDRPIHETYDSRLKLLELYDKAGFSTYHLTEHHFTPLGLVPSPLIFMAAASRITERIRFAPLVLIATLYNPLRLAAEICMVDHLTKGRFEIGTGRGVSPLELGFYNVSEAEAPAIYSEAMAVLMAALTQDVVDYHGKYFNFTNVPIEMKPLQRPHPPLWYATNSPESAARAARQNMNIVTLLPAAGARKVIAEYVEAWQAAHGARSIMPRAGITRLIYVGENEQQAEERGMFGFSGFYDKIAYLWRKYDVKHPALSEVSHGNKDMIITGTPATVRQTIERQLEESGANYFVPRFAYGDLTHEESVRSLELFTHEVMPHFRK
ncbi:MAG: LLM class flavin-dependent oxidoreductase [Candidatus Acidiferrales bacterium]|jgi:alkanesulfonate monooxygenase SsuD/methylene tetrahydromethanopterin reductase-like flavin-dependent oxidoreductase (luciferase family)